jgi:hypothetical protein
LCEGSDGNQQQENKKETVHSQGLNASKILKILMNSPPPRVLGASPSLSKERGAEGVLF